MAKSVVTIPASILNIIPRFERMKTQADNEAQRILEEGVKLSFRKRAYRTGAAMRDVATRQTGTVMNRRITAYNRTLLYPDFLERGTYKMKARKPKALGLRDVRRALVQNYEKHVADFAK